MMQSVVRCGCVCVWSVGLLCQAGGSVLILLNHGVVPVLT
jgi:hypothetical protein